MVSTAAVKQLAPAQDAPVAPFIGLKSTSAFPVTPKPNNDLSSLPSNGGRIRCMLVWPPEGLKKFETLSYLPELSQEALAKEIDYLLRKGWIPCLEFDSIGFGYRENHRSPGYYDGRYWTMWKLPMFGCTDSSQVLKEVEEAKKAYPATTTSGSSDSTTSDKSNASVSLSTSPLFLGQVHVLKDLHAWVGRLEVLALGIFVSLFFFVTFPQSNV